MQISFHFFTAQVQLSFYFPGTLLPCKSYEVKDARFYLPANDNL
jgi:hypothetical protein